MVPLARRLLTKEKARFCITAAGIGMIVSLVLLLFSIWEGVRTQANGYVRDRPVDLWVCQAHCTNLLRSTSYLSGSLAAELRRDPQVERLTPLLRLSATSTIGGRRATFFLIGFDPSVPEGRPALSAGTAQLGPGELVMDAGLAAKYRLRLGDSIAINGRGFVVRGLSAGTNTVIIQYGFVTLQDATALLGFPNVVSYWLVNVKAGASPRAVAAGLEKRSPAISVFTEREFTRNNQEEMRTGLIPILVTVAVLGALVGGVVLMLLMYSHVLEHRTDYAVLKAIGARQGFVTGVVLRQSLLAVVAGLVAGAVLTLAGAPLIRRSAPEILLALTWRVGLAVMLSALLIGLIGAWLPVRRLGRIYPAEVFRA